jgi:hypothetical protein
LKPDLLLTFCTNGGAFFLLPGIILVLAGKFPLMLFALPITASHAGCKSDKW